MLITILAPYFSSLQLENKLNKQGQNVAEK